jgi:hypothetical protein
LPADALAIPLTCAATHAAAAMTTIPSRRLGMLDMLVINTLPFPRT